MKLPASLLGQLRATVAVSAVLAGGCDLAGTAAADPDETPEATPQAQAADAPETEAPTTRSLAKTFAKTVTGATPSTVRETPEPRALEPLRAEEPADPSAFVPFSADPTGPRVKARAESPLAFAEPAPKRKRARPRTKPVKVGKPPAWDGCPACGRG